MDRCALATAVALSMATACMAAPGDLEVFTDFEGIDTNVGEPFDVGVAPELAEFSGDAFSAFEGILELYHSGVYAWMVNPGGTGLIDFQTPAGEVQFYARLISTANDSTVITAFDETNQPINSITLDDPTADFQLISFTGEIDYIQVVNQATGVGQMNSIDDFGFTAIPEPSTLVLALLGMVALLLVSLAKCRQRNSPAGTE